MAKIVKKVLQQYWRRTRGLSLDVKAIVLDSGDRVLLVRGRPSGAAWELPQARVKEGETVEEALRRMLGSDLKITFQDAPSFIALHALPAERAGHVAIVAVRHGNADMAPTQPPSLEACRFHVTALPAELASDAATWISQHLSRETQTGG